MPALKPPWRCSNIVRERNLKLTLEYDGTGFAGFAPQPDKRTVTAELEKALHKIFKKRIKLVGASRTDSGVHALGQVVNFKSKVKIQTSKLPYVINNLLPEDIRVIRADVVSLKFSARFSAKSKEYEYLIYNGAELPVHLRNQVWAIKPKLDIFTMRKAARALIGKHDFSSFCASGTKEKNFVRHLYSVKISNKTISVAVGRKLPVISIRFKGNAFLYKMIRNIVGTLVYVGLKKIKPEDIKKILEASDRRKAGKTAPPQGLYLIRVNY